MLASSTFSVIPRAGRSSGMAAVTTLVTATPGWDRNSRDRRAAPVFPRALPEGAENVVWRAGHDPPSAQSVRRACQRAMSAGLPPNRRLMWRTYSTDDLHPFARLHRGAVGLPVVENQPSAVHAVHHQTEAYNRRESRGQIREQVQPAGKQCASQQGQPGEHRSIAAPFTPPDPVRALHPANLRRGGQPPHEGSGDRPFLLKQVGRTSRS